MSQRILKEFKRLQTEPPVGLKAVKLHNNDKYKWRIYLEGPVSNENKWLNQRN